MTRVMKKLGLIFAALLLLVSSIPLLNTQSAKAADSTTDTSTTETTIKLGTTQTVASLPFYVAQLKQYYQAHNVTVELTQYKSTTDLNKAISDGTINGAVTDSVNFTTIHNDNKSWKIASSLTGYNGLVANKKYKNVKSLKGKTIAIDKKDGSRYYLKNLLAKNDMKLSDVKLQNVAEQGTRVSDLKDKKVDAAVVADPFISNAKHNKAKVLNKQKVSNKNGDVLALSSDIYSKKITDANNLINSYDDAVKDLNKQGFAPSDQLLVQLGASRSAAASMNSMDVHFAKAKRVKKADFDKAAKYAKNYKLVKTAPKLSSVQVKIDKVSK
jgi:NitT/TauT family transport system substrate-binding protein